MNINSKASVEPSIPAKKLEIFLSEDSDSEHQLRIVEDLHTKDMKPTKRRLMTGNLRIRNIRLFKLTYHKNTLKQLPYKVFNLLINLKSVLALYELFKMIH